ncbi:MAG TPA: NlpC/P60 family protein [Streptosporangiaceae bacterium]|nr:NlpC/P60 family protein [Streptosporangiaceae bacterium]
MAGGRPAAGAASRLRRGGLIVVGLATAGAVVGIGGSAVALPQPTVTQVKARLAHIEAKSSRLGQQFDQVLQQLSVANQRLNVLNKETARYRKGFEAMRRQIGRLAAVAYEQGDADSAVALLTSESPQQVLGQSSILTELSIANSSQIDRYRAASRQLLGAQQSATRARAGILQLKHSMAKRLSALKTLKQQQVTLLAKLTPPQQTGTGPGGGGGGGGGQYNGPTSTQAERAVAFAYNQIGCPYVFGGTGPCSAGFDCSGLTSAAWSYAGISIPRVSYDQMGSLPAVPLHTSSGAFTRSYLEPGDILGFAGNSHVGIYVGGGYLIDAPLPGANVEKVALSGWYLSELDGAVRP